MKARESESIERYAHRLYVADSLFYAGENKHLTEKYADIMAKIKTPTPKKTGDEVVTDMIRRHGLTFGQKKKESDG